MNVDLSKLNTRELAEHGDAALNAGKFVTAQRAYAELDRLAPGHSHVITRLGLAFSRFARSPILLAVLKAVEPLRPMQPFVSEGLATWLKTLPFMDDRRFMETAARHGHLLPLPNWHWNLHIVAWAVNNVRALDGDFVELGVFKGHTTLFTAEYVDFAAWPKTWYLYDTFDGVPEDQLDPGWEERNSRAYRGTFSYEEVRDRFAPFPNIKVIKGRVPEVLGDVSPNKIAFLHVDMNSAQAEIAALEVLYDRIVPGGVIIFDDYGWANARAQYDAENAWFKARGLTILALPTGQGLFIKPPA